MTKVSFIVPTKNAERTLAACLQSLRSQHHDDVEIVVVDNHSTDRTQEIARAWADRVEIAGPERCAQRNLGATVSRGEVLVFVDADMVLEPSIAADASAMIGGGTHDLLVLPELAFGESWLARCRALEKRLYLGDEKVEAGRAVRRALFFHVGGWDETLTAGEDWDLSDRLKTAGARVGRTRGYVWHDEGVVRLRAQFRKKRYYGRWVAEYVSRGGGGKHLARSSLFAHPRMLLQQPLETAGLFVLKAVEAAGLLTGMTASRLACRTGSGGSR